MIFKEAMTNVVKHSEATKVTLSFGKVGGNWYIELKDNGIGFEETGEVSGHFGLGNMKDRADKIQAKLTIASKKNKGTSIRLSNS
jgi:signal transduction histidine kinase